MADESPPLPDLAAGIPVRQLTDGAMVAGRVGDEDAVLVRSGDALFAIGAHCTHYHGPLAEGVVVGDTVRCPWHHACFSLRSGEAVAAPALDPVPCWRVEQVGDVAFVRERLAPGPARVFTGQAPDSIVIVGGGAAGLAAADMLRREGYEGSVTLVSADPSAPYDRPNLSKDFLAGNAPDDWIPLRGDEWYGERRIDLLLDTRVDAVDVAARRLTLSDGRSLPYGALLLATGADPVRLPVPGATDDEVHYLRTFADSRALVAKTATVKRVAVVGASFIGLEVAASLRARGIDVHVVAPESVPLERVMGAEVGRFVQDVHTGHGVTVHLGCTIARVDAGKVTLSDGSAFDADMIVLGVGVRPSIGLAQQAGLALDRGVVVNEYLETSAPGVFAAGDIARWPDPHTGERIRVEHWVVAERQGQAAARNMLGRGQRYDVVPFFWSQHYDAVINYVGHAEKWDDVRIDGSLAARDCEIAYVRGGRTLAVATVGRDRASLRAELALERSRAGGG
jgi:NADPH-dependent 2,4-dienoyl-CoA reductase/sulfur reductase-like enzyme/nitrite reductase/ring-hydroxylating ferredoxin subunit